MNKHATTNLILRSGLALGLTLSLYSPTPARAAEPVASMTPAAEAHEMHQVDRK